MTAEGRLAELDSDRRRREGEEFTERSGPVERQQFRSMRATLTDKKPPVAVSRGRGDISVSACESARCSNNHWGCLGPFFRIGDPEPRARARPEAEAVAKPFKASWLA